MQKFLFALSLGFLGVILAHSPAYSQQASCAERTQVVERLQSKYGETRRSVGLAANNGVVEVFASDNSGSWTIVITLPNGMTCLVAAGDSYETLDDAYTDGEKA
ncbi:hypothetical protein [Neptunicoccus cionae]|uniref:PepSY domain-containing protein n=1 Tax=Neptunicoccus cionae TaxID=2035344 RepID=A0A916R3M1_9RHOB|nr:hypothetical protein [Amylibacter cionae]GGA28835.1 hypothetical protein GCM10011498_32500 [Amylibacter cionae]